MSYEEAQGSNRKDIHNVEYKGNFVGTFRGTGVIFRTGLRLVAASRWPTALREIMGFCGGVPQSLGA
jgi:hypothetical protein